MHTFGGKEKTLIRGFHISIVIEKDDLFFYGREAVEFFYTKADTAIRMGIHPWKVEIHRHKTYAGDNVLCKYNIVEIKWNLKSHIDLNLALLLYFIL